MSEEANKILENSALALSVQLDDVTKEALDLEASLEVTKKESTDLGVALGMTTDTSVDLAVNQNKLSNATDKSAQELEKSARSERLTQKTKQKERTAIDAEIKARREELAKKLNNQQKLVYHSEKTSNDDALVHLNETVQRLIGLMDTSVNTQEQVESEDKFERTEEQVFSRTAMDMPNPLTNAVIKIDKAIVRIEAGIVESGDVGSSQGTTIDMPSESKFTREKTEKTVITNNETVKEPPVVPLMERLVKGGETKEELDKREQIDTKRERGKDDTFRQNMIASNKESKSLGDRLMDFLFGFRLLSILLSPVGAIVALGVAVAGVAAGVGAYIVKNWADIKKWLVDNVLSLFNSMVTKLDGLVPGLGKWVSDAIESTVDNFKRAINLIAKTLGFGVVFEDVVEKDRAKAKKAAEDRGEVWDGTVEEKGMVGLALDTMKGISPHGFIAEKIGDVIRSNETGAAILDAVSPVADTVIEYAGAAADGAAKAIDGVVGGVTDFVAPAFRSISDWWNDTDSTTSAIKEGAISAGQAAAGAAVKQVEGLNNQIEKLTKIEESKKEERLAKTVQGATVNTSNVNINNGSSGGSSSFAHQNDFRDTMISKRGVQSRS